MPALGVGVCPGLELSAKKIPLGTIITSVRETIEPQDVETIGEDGCPAAGCNVYNTHTCVVEGKCTATAEMCQPGCGSPAPGDTDANGDPSWHNGTLNTSQSNEGEPTFDQTFTRYEKGKGEYFTTS